VVSFVDCDYTFLNGILAPLYGLKKQAGLVIHRRAHRAGHLREFGGIEGFAFQIPNPQPLGAKTIEQRPGAMILQQTRHLRLQNRRFVESPAIRQRGKLGVGRGSPQQIRQTGRQLIVIQGNNIAASLGLPGWRDKEELGRNEDRLEHQAQGSRVGEFVLAPQIEYPQQDIQLLLRWGPAISLPGERAGDLARRRSRISPWPGRIAKQTLLRLRGRGAIGSIGGQKPVQHLIGDPEVLLRLEGRQRIQIPLAEHFIRQLTGDSRINAKEIVQGVAILRLGQTADHEGTRILCAEKFDLGKPVQELLPLLIRGLLVRFLRRHVVGLHVGERLQPPFAGGGVAGVLECWLEVDSAFPFLASVTFHAIGRDEWGDAIPKGLSGVGLKRGEMSVVFRLRLARRGQR